MGWLSIAGIAVAILVFGLSLITQGCILLQPERRHVWGYRCVIEGVVFMGIGVIYAIVAAGFAWSWW
jgi:hypothetical protein